MLTADTIGGWTREDCVRVVDGLGWPHSNSRMRGEPSKVCNANSIGYRLEERVDGRIVVFLLGQGTTFVFPNDGIVPFDPLATGDDVQRQAVHQEKVCATCFEVKILTEFAGNRKNNTITKTRPHCRSCYNHNAGKPLSAKKRREFLEQYNKQPGSVYQCPIGNNIQYYRLG